MLTAAGQHVGTESEAFFTLLTQVDAVIVIVASHAVGRTLYTSPNSHTRSLLIFFIDRQQSP